MMYLKLFHGRKDPNQDMEDWGEDGAILGPLQYVHTTYGWDIKIEFLDGEALNLSTAHEVDGVLHTDMVKHNDMFYGDWSVFYHPVVIKKEDTGKLAILEDEDTCLITEVYPDISQVEVNGKRIVHFTEISEVVNNKKLDIYMNGDNDQPTTCPLCGGRTDFKEITEDLEQHTCLECSYEFILELE